MQCNIVQLWQKLIIITVRVYVWCSDQLIKKV